MIHRQPPDPVVYDPGFMKPFSETLRFKMAQRELADEGQPAKLTSLKDERERFHARVAYFADKHGVERGEFGPLFERAKDELRPVAVAPIRDRPIDDLIAAWCDQPEGRAAWEQWMPDSVQSGRYPVYEGSKAVMIAVGGMGLAPHFRNVLNVVEHSGEFRSRFTKLAGASPRARVASGEPLKIRGYTSILRHVAKLSPEFPPIGMSTCIECVRELARLYPEAGIGRDFSIDADMVAAWCPQRSSYDRRLKDHNPDKEDELRRRTPEAGYRAYAYNDGAEDASPGPNRKARRQIARAVRGYLLLVLSEIVTGLPVVGILVDASKLHEPDGLEQLLPLLFQLWPDVPIEAIVGDKLYDEKEAHLFCAVHYGVRLVAIRKESHKRTGGIRFGDEESPKGEVRHKSLLRISGTGIAYCREHNLPLAFEGSEWPSRDGLAPGEPFSNAEAKLRARDFRSRWACPLGCGRLSAAMRLAPSALPYYPLNPNGRLDLFAMRLALQAARNTSETGFSSIEIGFKQALQSRVRTRIFDKNAVEALIWVALATRALQMVADQRGYSRVPLRRAA